MTCSLVPDRKLARHLKESSPGVCNFPYFESETWYSSCLSTRCYESHVWTSLHICTWAGDLPRSVSDISIPKKMRKRSSRWVTSPSLTHWSTCRCECKYRSKGSQVTWVVPVYVNVRGFGSKRCWLPNHSCSIPRLLLNTASFINRTAATSRGLWQYYCRWPSHARGSLPRSQQNATGP